MSCCTGSGWFNLLGQVAVTAAIEYTLANHLSAMIVLGTGGAGTGGKVITQGQLLGIYAGNKVHVIQGSKQRHLHLLLCCIALQ